MTSSGPWPTRPRVVDGALALACGVAAATGTWGANSFFGPSLLGPSAAVPPWTVGVPAGVVVALAAFWRRRQPLLFAVTALLANLVVAAQLVVMVALYTLAERGTARTTVLGVTAVATVLGAVPIWRYAGADGAVPTTIAFCVVPVLFGLYVATRRELVARMQERTQRLERQQADRIARARSDERARIARDMHDVLTHRVALMVLQATALEAAPRAEVDHIGRQIGTTGREALTELRTLVEVLRAEETAPTGPQPGLGDLERLVHDSRAIGLPVTLTRIGGTAVRVPVLVEHAAYRVVQEALTNVHKHAPCARTHVEVQLKPEALTLVVRNDRGTTPVPPPLPDGGHGLLGVGERIRLVRGTLTAGRTDDGGFELTAHIPLPPADVP